jgi:hypothetical protein
MELTPRELKKIERLRKQERQWPLTRWFMLVGGIITAIEFLFLLGLLFHQLFLTLNDTSAFGSIFFSVNILMFAIHWPTCLAVLYISGWSIITAIRDWHGNINRILLLKLLDAQQSASALSAKTS